ncbi:MAG: hypothetical protein WC525_07285 [Candidatus Thermoplasmatota archaeon]
METHAFTKNLRIVGILFLLFNSIIIPTISLAEQTEKDDHVTITVRTPGFLEDSTTTVLLTRTQLREIETIFDTLRNRLSTARTNEETRKIFNDTIIELDRYHILPEDMSVALAQRLVNHAFLIQRTPLFQKLSQKFQGTPVEGAIQNSFCSVAGNTTNTHFAKLAKRTALRLYYLIDYYTGNALLVKIATALYVVCRDISKINQLFLQQDGRHLGVCIYYGNYHYTPYPNWLSPATGWISTDGVKGKQNISGSFWGQTMTGGWQPQVDWYMNYSWRGCLGFTGLILYDDTDTAYYLGSALAVNVGPDRP